MTATQKPCSEAGNISLKATAFFAVSRVCFVFALCGLLCFFAEDFPYTSGFRLLRSLFTVGFMTTAAYLFVTFLFWVKALSSSWRYPFLFFIPLYNIFLSYNFFRKHLSGKGFAPVILLWIICFWVMIFSCVAGAIAFFQVTDLSSLILYERIFLTGVTSGMLHGLLSIVVFRGIEKKSLGKKFVLTFLTALILSLTWVWLGITFLDVRHLRDYGLKFSSKDVKSLKSLSKRLTDAEKEFEEKILKSVYDENKNNIMLHGDILYVDEKEFETPNGYSMALKLVEAFRNIFEAKQTIASDGVGELDFARAYDSLEYNFTTAVALSRIIHRINAKNKDIEGDGTVFSLVAETIIKNGCGNTEDEGDFEQIFRWYAGYSALKASFDAIYLQIMFGKDYYSSRDLKKMAEKMRILLASMHSCLPPKNFTLFPVSNLATLTASYEAKQSLAEYLAFAVRQSDVRELQNIGGIYATKNISALMVDSLGGEAFKTLGNITAFELFSKEIATSKASGDKGEW